VTGPVENYQAAGSYNRRLEKDESTGSIPHVLATGLVWRIGRVWEVGSGVKAQSGMPVTVMRATNCGAAFTGAGQAGIGNASRNPVRGPGYQAADPMVGNLFACEIAGAPRPSTGATLSQPNGSFGAAAFGGITTAGDPRVFELALRLKF
jgi:hypothetical protein